jgi:SAM-dependent methyltransferase
VTQDTSEHAAKVRGFFDARVAAYDAFYDPPSRFARWFNAIFRRAVFLRRDHTLTLARRYGCRTVLDVGCGSGRNAIWFARHGIDHVFGVDVSADMIDEARELAARAGVADRCEFHHTDFLSMQPGPRFDLVIALGVFDYVEQAEEFLRHMAAFADRAIYGSFPGWTLVRTPLRKIRYAFQGCPTHFYRRRELLELFAAVGFGPAELRPVPSGCLAWSAKPGLDAQ